MHPQAVAIDTQGIIGIQITLIVDGIGRQPGQIDTLLLGQRLRQGQRGCAQGHTYALRIGIVGALPMLQAQQQRMRALRGLGALQRLQDPALLTLPPGQFLDLAQIRRILWRQPAGAGPFQKTIPGRTLSSLGSTRTAFLLNLGQRSGADLLGRALKIQTLLDQPPACPGRCRRAGAVNQLGQLSQRGLPAIEQLAGRFGLTAR